MEKKRDNLLFLGIIDREKMNGVYNMADVFVLPSYNELFPMALLENCETKHPYIVRDLELYKDILVGDYLRANDSNEFSALLRKLKSDEVFYNSSKSLSEDMSEKYSEEKLYEMWKNYYYSIFEKYNKN